MPHPESLFPKQHVLLKGSPIFSANGENVVAYCAERIETTLERLYFQTSLGLVGAEVYPDEPSPMLTVTRIGLLRHSDGSWRCDYDTAEVLFEHCPKFIPAKFSGDEATYQALVHVLDLLEKEIPFSKTMGYTYGLDVLQHLKAKFHGKTGRG